MPDLELHDRLAAAQVADRRSPIRSARNPKSSGVGGHHRRELGGQALGLAKHRSPPPRARFGRRQVAEAAALGDAVSPAVLLVERVSSGLAPSVVGEQGPGHPLGPARLAVLGAVSDVHHPEQVSPIGVSSTAMSSSPMNRSSSGAARNVPSSTFRPYRRPLVGVVASLTSLPPCGSAPVDRQ